MHPLSSRGKSAEGGRPRDLLLIFTSKFSSLLSLCSCALWVGPTSHCAAVSPYPAPTACARAHVLKYFAHGPPNDVRQNLGIPPGARGSRRARPHLYRPPPDS